ncbi:MAG TPA: phosphatase PAP2 family protein [Solirubrobacteraceae bacterium]|nr:phosphatase PAP2 family protein [Solirubrobacteraceae bacterium]
MDRRVKLALIGAALSAGLLLLCWFMAFHVGFAARADVSILNGFTGLSHGSTRGLAYRIAHLCSPDPYVYLAAVPVLIALLRRRPLVALAILAILIGANATTELLKPLLAASRPAPPPDDLITVAQGSWPSGHATAAMSLALCCVLAAPARLRPWVAALGAAFAVVVSFSFLSLAWHYPSDVCGGFLIATAWTALGIAALFAVDRGRVPAKGTRRSLLEALEPPVAAVCAALALVAVVLLARPHAVVAYARLHKGFVVGAVVIAALGLALATVVMLALRNLSGSGRAPTGALRRGSPHGSG